MYRGSIWCYLAKSSKTNKHILIIRVFFSQITIIIIKKVPTNCLARSQADSFGIQTLIYLFCKTFDATLVKYVHRASFVVLIILE